MTFGEELKLRYKKQGMTRIDLVNTSKVSYMKIRMLEKNEGLDKTTFFIILRISKALGWELLDMVNKMARDSNER